jgi:hypothetical protein
MESQKDIAAGKSLAFNPSARQGRYGVLIDCPNNKLRFHYQVDYKISHPLARTWFRYNINQTPATFHRGSPRSKVCDFAQKLAESIYPLDLDITDEQKIFRIANHDAMLARARQAINDFLPGYDTDEAVARSNNVWRRISDADTLKADLEADFFYKLFFYRLHGPYSKEGTAEGILPLTLNGELLTFHTVARWMPQDREDGKVMITVDGRGSNDRKEWTLFARYLLYPEDHGVACITGEIHSAEDIGRPWSLAFEIYHLDAAARIVHTPNFLSPKPVEVRKRPSVYLGVDEMPQKQKGFWGLFKS